MEFHPLSDIVPAVDGTVQDIAVTAAPGGAGQSVSASGAGSMRVANISPGARVQVRSGSDAWITLQPQEELTFGAAAVAAGVSVRRGAYDGGPVRVQAVVIPSVSGVGAVPARITGGNKVGDVLTVERAEGWQFTTGQWYLDGVATGSATAGLTLTQLSAAIGKAYGFQPTGIPFRATAAVTVAADVVPTAPGAPTGVSATAGDATVTYAGAAPASNGGSPILEYRVTQSTGELVYGATLPITAVDQTNGVARTGTVAARNAVGWGPESAASNSVTPQAAAGSTTGIVVANRLQNPAAIGGSIPNLQTFQRAHWSHSAGAISNLKLTNLYWSTSTGGMTPTNPTGNPTNTWKQWIEYPVGVFTPVLFGGADTCVMSSSAKQVTSDAVNITIPANTEFWVHTMNAGAAAVMCVIQLPATAATLGVRDCSYAAASATAPAHQAAGSAGSSFIGPACITGDVAASGAQAVLLGGDSLVFGQGDITSAGSRGSSGFMPRRLDVIGASYIKLCSSGSTADQAATQFNSGNADHIAFLNVIRPATTRAVCEWGINDVQQGRTQAQLQASHTIIHTVFGNGGRPVSQTTLTPRASSTDSYATVANQAQRTDGNMANWAAINTGIRGLSGVGVIEVANVVCDTPGGLVFACPVGATPPSTDGTHLTSSMAAYAAENISYSA